MNLIFNGCKNEDLIRSDGRKGGKREVDMSRICPEVLLSGHCGRLQVRR